MRDALNGEQDPCDYIANVDLYIRFLSFLSKITPYVPLKTLFANCEEISGNNVINDPFLQGHSTPNPNDKFARRIYFHLECDKTQEINIVLTVNFLFSLCNGHENTAN